MGHVNTCRILLGKHEGKRLLGKPIGKYSDNKKINSTEIRWNDADWIYVAQDRNNWRVYV
jgi:hypothetical protein